MKDCGPKAVRVSNAVVNAGLQKVDAVWHQMGPPKRGPGHQVCEQVGCGQDTCERQGADSNNFENIIHYATMQSKTGMH